MSRNDFTPAEFESRRDRVRAALRAAKIDWLVMFHPVSIHWLTGSDAKSYQEFQCLLLSAHQPDLWVLTREGERIEFETDALVDHISTWGGGVVEDPVVAFQRFIAPLRLTSARVGIEVPAYYLHPHHYLGVRQALGTALVSEPTNLVHDLKLVKSPAEQDCIREASRIADIGLDAFVAALRPGHSELAIAGEIYRATMAAGSGLAASPINLVSGDRSSYSHGAPTQRLLAQGDFGSVEYGTTFKRYTSTIGRQFCLGSPTDRMREIYDVVRAATDACIAAIRASVPATVPHEAARRVIVSAGLEHGRVHTTGYGLAPGFPPTWGEPLHMLNDSSYTLAAGMVLTVEPPVFLAKERLGARIIENVLVTESGCEVLSRRSRDLIVV